MRRFEMIRTIDVTGASGTGRVAEGVQFGNGKVVICWLTPRSSIVIWDTIVDAVAIHGHDGLTEFNWLDPEPSEHDEAEPLEGSHAAQAAP